MNRREGWVPLIVLGLALSVPTVVLARTSSQHPDTNTQAQKAANDYNKQLRKSQKQANKTQKKQMKQWKKAHPTA